MFTDLFNFDTKSLTGEEIETEKLFFQFMLS